MVPNCFIIFLLKFCCCSLLRQGQQKNLRKGSAFNCLYTLKILLLRAARQRYILQFCYLYSIFKRGQNISTKTIITKVVANDKRQLSAIWLHWSEFNYEIKRHHRSVTNEFTGFLASDINQLLIIGKIFKKIVFY